MVWKSYWSIYVLTKDIGSRSISVNFIKSSHIFSLTSGLFSFRSFIADYGLPLILSLDRVILECIYVVVLNLIYCLAIN